MEQTLCLPKSQVVKARRSLLAWYEAAAREMPWRGTRDPYAIWLSEVILQQTRVLQGGPYYERFLAAFPTVESLAAAEPDAVMKLWEGLGYYTRARNLMACAKVVANELGSGFPHTARELERLPGIGPYTAAAIASIAFGEPVAAVDGNVIRVVARLMAIEGDIGTTPVRRVISEAANALLAPDAPGDFNQAMMDLGAHVCTPRNPQCGACPLHAQCAAYRKGAQERLPVKTRKAPTPHYDVAVAVIERDGLFLIGRRPADGLLGGLWEFPGGKVQPGETLETALIRELAEEIGVTAVIGERFATVKHAYTHFRITLAAFRCRIAEGEPQSHAHDELRWVRREDLHTYAFPTANKRFLEMV